MIVPNNSARDSTIVVFFNTFSNPGKVESNKDQLDTCFTAYGLIQMKTDEHIE